jgi:hypothetical protein
MPIVLLLLGLVTAVAGLALVGAGLPTRETAFDTEVLTPGTIAVVGGLLLVGLGVAVRELRRIERVLAARPMPHVARPEEVTEAAAVVLRSPIPSEPKIDVRPVVTATVNEAERLRSKFPVLTQTANAAAAEVSDPTVEPQIAAQLKAEAELSGTVAGAQATRGVAALRTAGRPNVKTRPTIVASKTNGSVLGNLSPFKTRRGDEVTAATPATEPAAEQDATSATTTSVGEVPISILKSGVVEGMAYTLYSDGSIEAQLPQGTLRFGSISALRSHMERTA